MVRVVLMNHDPAKMISKIAFFLKRFSVLKGL